MSAVLHALLTVTSEPVELVKKDGSPVCTVTAREADDHQGKRRQLFQLFGLSEKSRRTIAGLGPGDAVSVVGPIAARIEAGVVVLRVNAVECQMQLPITLKPKPRAPKPGRCGGGTRMASAAGVEAANAAYAARKASE